MTGNTQNTAPADTTTDGTTKPLPGTGHHGQTFLVGDEIYIRAVEPADAKYGTSWRNSLFPWSTDRHEKWIKEEMIKEERTATYIIVRKNDDVPVGSVKTQRWDPTTFVEPHVDPLFGDRGQRWMAEALRLMLPWLVDEQHRPAAIVFLTPDDGPAIEAMDAIGGRQVARFREMIFRNGRHTDRLIFEYLNRQWVKTLGDPNEIEPERTGTGEARPVPVKVTLDGDPPKNAMLVGPRVYLRPIEAKDAEVVARASRQETETFWDNGRFMRSAIGFSNWTENLQKEDPQEWVRFAVCLRENDEFIGSIGIDEVQYVHRNGESESEIHRQEYRGSGYGSEAKHLLFEYAFDHLKLHSLQSYVIFPNTRSAAALRKQGYREAGRLNWEYAIKGGFGNLLLFDLLAAEWRAMPRTDAIAAGDR
jgi:RimJ/RimL family protein N-acetyltransferase